MIRLGVLLLLLSCASRPDTRPYLLTRAKQKHEVTVYAPDGTESFRSLSFGILSDESAQLNMLSPLGFTLLKAEVKRQGDPVLSFLSPTMREYGTPLKILLKKLGKLFWLKQGEHLDQVTFKSFYEDGTLKDFEWQVASQRICVRIEKL